MKRRDLIRMLERSGCLLLRHGSRHDLYRNPVTGQQAPIPRHREVGESLVKIIIRQLGLVSNQLDEASEGDIESDNS